MYNITHIIIVVDVDSHMLFIFYCFLQKGCTDPGASALSCSVESWILQPPVSLGKDTFLGGMYVDVCSENLKKWGKNIHIEMFQMLSVCNTWLNSVGRGIQTTLWFGANSLIAENVYLCCIYHHLAHLHIPEDNSKSVFHLPRKSYM